MGHKVNPLSIRLKINEIWKSQWFDKQHYRESLVADLKIRRMLAEKLRTASVSRIEINRDANKVVIDIYSSRPGLIIGRKGTGTEELRNQLNKIVDSKVQINIIEVKNPDTNAAIIAQGIASQMERRTPYKRAVRQFVERAKDANVKGIKVQVAGRLNGAEIARSEKTTFGTVPLSTLRSDIDYSFVTALTTYGIIGIKVWIYKGQRGMEEILNRKK